MDNIQSKLHRDIVDSCRGGISLKELSSKYNLKVPRIDTILSIYHQSVTYDANNKEYSLDEFGELAINSFDLREGFVKKADRYKRNMFIVAIAGTIITLGSLGWSIFSYSQSKELELEQSRQKVKLEILLKKLLESRISLRASGKSI